MGRYVRPERPNTQKECNLMYIKREDAIAVCEKEQDASNTDEAKKTAWRCGRAMYDLPSADVVERKSGEWIHSPNGIDRNFIWWVCSECGHKIFSETEKDRREFHAFCGRCGADMRGKDNENN